MKKIKTSSGFVAEINEDVGRDWRLFDAVADAQSDDTSTRMRGVRQICLLLLGKSGYVALQQHLAEPDGTVDVHAMEREIIEIFGAVGESTKN